MAGGSATNIFKLNRGDYPPECFNWRLWLAVLSFGIMGAARGVDEGLISGTLARDNFRELLSLSKMSAKDHANIEGTISAMVQLGSVGGAALAFILCDRIGRLWATRQLCVIWMIGTIIFVTNGGRLWQVYFGRLIMGLGIGQTTVVAPVYLSEIAPKTIRGLCTCMFSGSVYIGIMLAYFAILGCKLHMPDGDYKQWVVPTMLHILFAGIILILSFFNSESPRYLIMREQREKAVASLARIRGLAGTHDIVQNEIDEIEEALRQEREATEGQGAMGILREMFCVRKNFYRIYLGLMGQILSQWSGAQSITVYAPKFFAILGVKGNTKLYTTAIFGVVKFLAGMSCALWLVDAWGRKRSLITGITLQALSMVYVAAFQTAAPTPGEGESYTPSQQRASYGALVAIYISGIGWAMGWNSMQYLLNAELYPLQIRTTSSSLVMCFHFINQYGNTRAVANMLLPTEKGGLGSAGTFWLMAIVTVIGGAWAWVTIPETANLSVEEIDRLFELPWYKIGLFGRKDAEQKIANERPAEEEKKSARAEARRVESREDAQG